MLTSSSAAAPTMNHEAFDQLFDERPRVHTDGSGHTCWGILREVAELIYQSIGENSVTLETGAGLSTLVFALRRSSHTAVTPSAPEKIHEEMWNISHDNTRLTRELLNSVWA
jgi:hypothetical protein